MPTSSPRASSELFRRARTRRTSASLPPSGAAGWDVPGALAPLSVDGKRGAAGWTLLSGVPTLPLKSSSRADTRPLRSETCDGGAGDWKTRGTNPFCISSIVITPSPSLSSSENIRSATLSDIELLRAGAPIGDGVRRAGAAAGGESSSRRVSVVRWRSSSGIVASISSSRRLAAMAQTLLLLLSSAPRPTFSRHSLVAVNGCPCSPRGLHQRPGGSTTTHHGRGR